MQKSLPFMHGLEELDSLFEHVDSRKLCSFRLEVCTLRVAFQDFRTMIEVFEHRGRATKLRQRIVSMMEVLDGRDTSV